VLAGNAGNDQIDGGEGTDAVQFTGKLNDYAFRLNPDGSLILSDLRGADGTDRVINVENFSFADGTVTYQDLLRMLSQQEISSDSVGDGSTVAPDFTVDRADGSVDAGNSLEFRSGDQIVQDLDAASDLLDGAFQTSQAEGTGPIAWSADPELEIAMESTDWAEFEFGELEEAVNGDNVGEDTSSAVDSEDQEFAPSSRPTSFSLWGLLRALGGSRDSREHSTRQRS